MRRGGHYMTYYTSPKNVNGRTLHDILQDGLMGQTHVFNTLLCYNKFTHSWRVSERREGKRERQVMPPLVLLIKFVLLLIIFQVIFSVNLLVANWRLLPEFWLPKLFSTWHGDQNGRSLECCPVAPAPWSIQKLCNYFPEPSIEGLYMHCVTLMHLFYISYIITSWMFISSIINCRPEKKPVFCSFH